VDRDAEAEFAYGEDGGLHDDEPELRGRERKSCGKGPTTTCS
jgi:hypothetical protein